MNQTQKNEFQIAGKLTEVRNPEYVSPKLTKRTFAIEVWSGNYGNPVLFELRNERGNQLDGLKAGTWVIVTFELNGRKVVKDDKPIRFYNSLNCLTIIKG